MKVEYTDVSDTQKSLLVEIPADEVGTEIDRVIRDYAKSLRIPGFRPGRIPPKIIRQRYKAQVLQDVAQDLIPRAVEHALRERGVEPIETPSVRDVSIEEGRPLTFTAAFETAPPVDPGSYASLTVRRPPVQVTPEQIDQALTRLRESAARFQPVTDRAAEAGDTVVMNLTRTPVATEGEAAGTAHAGSEGESRHEHAHDHDHGHDHDHAHDHDHGHDHDHAHDHAHDHGHTHAAPGEPERLEDVGVEIGAPANPPGFDDHLLGVAPGTEKSFRVRFPDDYGVESLAGRELDYAIQVMSIRRKIVPALDDELAKDLGYDSLEPLKTRVEENLRREGERQRERTVRQDLLQQLAKRVPFDAPEALVAREVDRRVEEFVHQLIDQRIDPMRTNIDWEQFRTEQREPAVNTVKCMLVLDEIARRESLQVDEAELDAEIGRYAEASGQPAEAVRTRLEKEGAISRIYAGLRREKAIDFSLAHATILEV
jgi:trigger factor